MKKTVFVLVLAMVMILAMGSVAHAATIEGINGISEWVTSDSIHQGYASSVNACKVCHDVHENPNAKLFITDNMNDGCGLCHTGGTTGVQVYTGTERHTRGAMLIPDSGGTNGPADDLTANISSGGLICIDCHDAAPHGAGAPDPFIVALSTESTSMTDFCLKCHEVNDGRLVGGQRTDKLTHVMAGLGATYTEFGSTTTSHADVGANSSTCANCHTNGTQTDFPHSGNYKLLVDGSTAKGLDVECRMCHGDTVGSMY